MGEEIEELRKKVEESEGILQSALQQRYSTCSPDIAARLIEIIPIRFDSVAKSSGRFETLAG